MSEINRHDAVMIPGDPIHYAGIVDGFTGSGLIRVTWFALDLISDEIIPGSAKHDVHCLGELLRRPNFIDPTKSKRSATDGDCS
jgi:hypothetical protein